MYNTSDSVPRADLSTVLMEAVDQEGLYIAQELLPVMPSAKEVGRYPKFTKALTELLNSGKGVGGWTKRGATGTYNEVDRKFSWDTYQTEEYGLEERVDDVVARRMENFFDAESVTAKLLMNQLMLDFEVETSALINSPGIAFTYDGTAATNLGGTFTTYQSSVKYAEANTAGSTPFDVPFDVTAAVERLTLLGELPNFMALSLSLWNRIRRSQKLQTYVYGYLNVTQGGSQITPKMFAEVFGIEELLISKKSVNMALKGKTPNLQPVWGNSYIAIGKRASGDFMNGGVGRTIIWDADAPGGLFTSESYRDERRRGNMLRVRSNRTQKILIPDSLQLIDCGFSGSWLTE